MMTRLHIHLDAVGGIAGDMFVAAMLEAAPDLTPRMMADLAAVLPEEAGQPELSSAKVSGMAASRFRLSGGRDGGHHHRHDRGTYVAFRQAIVEAPLAEGTVEHATGILHRIAEAEAAIHDVPIDEVHFHELADWDALADVVAAGSIVAALGDASRRRLGQDGAREAAGARTGDGADSRRLRLARRRGRGRAGDADGCGYCRPCHRRQG
jgi:hypothetical protein